jgi:SNF2 family DNA or RNA helicase
MDNLSYQEFLNKKLQSVDNYGFKPIEIPTFLFDFQKSLVEWSLFKGRCALFEDCGLGKTIQELVWANNVVRYTNKPVLILTPLSVSIQTELEAKKFGIESKKSKDGKINSEIVITNYERLHYYNPDDFGGIVCDESSILKNFKGAIKSQINIFMRKIKYRLLATATAAPNDYIELGTSSEALGYLGYMDMLGKFFKNDNNNCSTKRMGREIIKWRLKGHAHESFWRWITSWSRAVRKPSDLGYDDKDFVLPKLNVNNLMLKCNGFNLDGYFPEFNVIANGLKEEREETRSTIKARCEKAASIANNSKDFNVIWCNLNDEGNLLEKLIPDSIQISGRDNDEQRENKLISFSQGQSRVMIIKPKIGAFGLNWQHCNHVIYFPTHSYEQYYQAIRRCWRFGQKREVNVDVIYSEGFENVVNNLERKQGQADKMFESLVKEMNNSLSIDKNKIYNLKENIPSWLKN